MMDLLVPRKSWVIRSLPLAVLTLGLCALASLRETCSLAQETSRRGVMRVQTFMNRLFFKIFLWFCVIVVLVGISIETSSILANYYEVQWQRVLHSVMPMEAEKCARMYETSGKQAVQDYLDELQRQKTVRFYFFDEDGNPLLDRGAPPLILKLAANKASLNRTAQQNLSMVLPREGIAMRLVSGPSGRKYNLAFQQSPTVIMPISEAVGSHPYLRLAAIGLFGAILCASCSRDTSRIRSSACARQPRASRRAG